MANTKNENSIQPNEVGTLFEELKSNEPAFYSLLIEKGCLTIRGLGTFEIIKKDPFMFYSPKTKVKKMHDGRVRIAFRPTRGFKQFVKDNVNRKRKTGMA